MYGSDMDILPPMGWTLLNVREALGVVDYFSFVDQVLYNLSPHSD